MAVGVETVKYIELPIGMESNVFLPFSLENQGPYYSSAQQKNEASDRFICHMIELQSLIALGVQGASCQTHLLMLLRTLRVGRSGGKRVENHLIDLRGISNHCLDVSREIATLIFTKTAWLQENTESCENKMMADIFRSDVNPIAMIFQLADTIERYFEVKMSSPIDDISIHHSDNGEYSRSIKFTMEALADSVTALRVAFQEFSQ